MKLRRMFIYKRALTQRVEVKKMSVATLRKNNHDDTRGTRSMITKKPRSMKELRAMLGVRGAFGRTLNDLHKQGR